MTRSLTIIISLFCALSVSAQNLDTDKLKPGIRRFYNGCLELRSGMLADNLTALARAVDLLDTDPMSTDALSIEQMTLTAVRGSDECSPEGLPYYTWGYADHLMNEKDGAYREEPEFLRGGLNTPAVAYRAIKAGGSITYSIPLQNDVQFLAIPQPGYTLKVNASLNGQDVTVAEYDEGWLSAILWDTPQTGNLTITITNPTDRDLSFALAKQ